ncbi:hypothetical protein C0J52_09642 [Blattella germanica]|nr:hypothetical protein C0J52_09642 [Blattella germanica]
MNNSHNLHAFSLTIYCSKKLSTSSNFYITLKLLIRKEYAEQLRITDGNWNRKSRNSPANVELEKKLYGWFIKQRRQGIPMNPIMLCEKAMTINKELLYKVWQ